MVFYKGANYTSYHKTCKEFKHFEVLLYKLTSHSITTQCINTGTGTKKPTNVSCFNFNKLFEHDIFIEFQQIAKFLVIPFLFFYVRIYTFLYVSSVVMNSSFHIYNMHFLLFPMHFSVVLY